MQPLNDTSVVRTFVADAIGSFNEFNASKMCATTQTTNRVKTT